MGKETKKTDNAKLAPKLELRRYFLSRYHSHVPPVVFDCCQGEGVIWHNLRKEFPVERYWGVDLKPKTGRVKVDSSRVLNQPGWEFDVIDVDTYGEPWEHWKGILEFFPHDRDLTVFLTIGHVQAGGGGGLSRYAAEALGIKFRRSVVKIKSGLYGGLFEQSILACIARAYEAGVDIVEAMEAERGAHARYIGLRLARRRAVAADLSVVN